MTSLFPAADWLWKPIPPSPKISGHSATWVGYFSAHGTQHVANLRDYGVTMVPASAVTALTPRYRVTLTEKWGSNPFGSTTIPIPTGTPIPPGSDGHIAVQDPISGQVFGLWQAKYNSKTDTWSASWGGMTPINGNGIDTAGSATATGISRYAGVVGSYEFGLAIAANGRLNHALFISSDIAGSSFVPPAIKSDGVNQAGVALPIPEGSRIQLDPTVNVDAIPGITPAEKVIAKTLQTYGAYVGDRGGARMAFIFRMISGSTPTNPGSEWTNAGLAWDYFDMAHIPWAKLRVLA